MQGFGSSSRNMKYNKLGTMKLMGNLTITLDFFGIVNAWMECLLIESTWLHHYIVIFIEYTKLKSIGFMSKYGNITFVHVHYDETFNQTPAEQTHLPRTSKNI